MTLKLRSETYSQRKYLLYTLTMSILAKEQIIPLVQSIFFNFEITHPVNCVFRIQVDTSKLV